MKRVALLIITGTLFVFSTEEKPSVKLQPETVTVQEGENVTLFCNSSGSSLTITWKFNGSNVTTSDSRISFSVDNRNLIITNVSRGNEGEYKCVARNNVGNDTSNTAFVLVELDRPRRPPSFGPPPIRVSEVPDPPHSLTIDSKSSRVVIISWTADLYGIRASENYTVEISQYNQNFMDAVCQGSLSSNACVVSSYLTKASLTGLLPWTTYNIRVFATNEIGKSNSSHILTVTTDEEEPSAPPLNVRGHNISSTSILVVWGEVPTAYRNGIITSYNITYYSQTENHSNSTRVDHPVRQVTLPGLKEFVNYSITVFASTVKGNGPKSDPIIVSTGEDEPSAPPADIRGHNTSSTSILVEWGEVPPADQNGIILTYTISYQSLTQNDKGRKKVASSIQKLNLTDLKKFVNYNITLFASTVKGNGKPSDPIFVVTDQDRPSAAPQNLRSINTTSTSIFVMWDEVLPDEQNGIIIRFNVSYRAIPLAGSAGPIYSIIVKAPAREVYLTGLTKDMYYNISVLASTIKGDGIYSSPKTFRTREDRPGAPPQNVQGYNTSSTSINVTWNEVLEEKQHGDIIRYTVMYKKMGNVTYESVKVTPISGNFVELRRLNKFTFYDIKVSASTRVGNGPASNPIKVQTDEDVPSAAPELVSVQTLNSTSIQIEWLAVPEESIYGIPTRYTIYYANSDGKVYTKVVTPVNVQNTYQEVVSGLKESTEYSFQVSLSTAKGEGPLSVSKSSTTKGGLPVTRTTFAVNVTEGESVSLNCTLSGDGSYTWERQDGTELENAKRKVRGGGRLLEIIDTAIADSGNYTCKTGRSSHTITLQVLVEVKVEMALKVENYNYTKELENKSSLQYKLIETNFTAEMDFVYKDTPGYIKTVVLKMTKGSVVVDFNIVIQIITTDPKNETTIKDQKASIVQTTIKEAEDGFVKRLKVSKVIPKTEPPEPNGVEIFDIKSDELSVRWKPSEDAETFDVRTYSVQYRAYGEKTYSEHNQTANTENADYSYRIKSLESETVYMIRVGAVNTYGSNFNEETGHETEPAPFAWWIIVLAVLGVLLILGILIGIIIYRRRRARDRREQTEARFRALENQTGSHKGEVAAYHGENVKGLTYSFKNTAFKPGEMNWQEFPHENIKLLDELGSGAFGIVFKGELQQENGIIIPCAVKTLKPSATKVERKDLYNELEIMANVGHHPNLVNLIGACTQDDLLLVIIELAENGCLLDFLKQSRQQDGNNTTSGLTEHMKTSIAVDVARGMAHLARCRCIHRDLAARNVLLGKDYVAKVSDYGMARDVYEQLMYKKETQGKLPVKWMAVESLETYTFTMESDVWAYGVLLWEIESGGLKPYAGLSTAELIENLKNGYRMEKPNGCSDEMYQTMRDCWNSSPSARPNFDELIVRLESTITT